MLGGLRSAVQLISMFNISNEKLYLDGVSDGIPLSEGNVDLKFCDSSCTNTLRQEFLVSGYSVHKLSEPATEDECNGLSPWECALAVDCDYLVESSMCKNRTIGKPMISEACVAAENT